MLRFILHKERQPVYTQYYDVEIQGYVVGALEQDNASAWAFLPDDDKAISSGELRLIADKLDELNTPKERVKQ